MAVNVDQGLGLLAKGNGGGSSVPSPLPTRSLFLGGGGGGFFLAPAAEDTETTGLTGAGGAPSTCDEALPEV